MSDRLARGWPSLVAIALAGLIALVLAAVVNQRDLAFSPGVPITRVAAALDRGETACQRAVRVVEPFTAVELVPRWLGSRGPPLTVEVTEYRSRRRVARVAVTAGYPDNRPLRVATGAVDLDRRVDVCITNRGPERVGIEGGEAESAAPSALFVDGRENDASALALRFLHRPRSVASQLPVAFERAALFRPGWVGPWTFWLLALAVGLGVPALLARALATAVREDSR
jgi:hypothetical protein